MTLLETLIAISLLAMLLTIVFGFFRELSEITHLTEQKQKESFQMRYLESRLSFIFERIVHENESARTFFFYTQPPQKNFSDFTSLILTFNNEVRINPTFSGDILGRLYVDVDHCLRLAMWPMHLSQPHQYLQEEVLLENVAEIHYEFYAAPERISNVNAIPVRGQQHPKPDETQPEKDKWHTDEWLLTHYQMPSIIKLIITLAKNPKALDRSNIGTSITTETLVYSFVLPSSKNPVYYPPD